MSKSTIEEKIADVEELRAKAEHDPDRWKIPYWGEASRQWPALLAAYREQQQEIERLREAASAIVQSVTERTDTMSLKVYTQIDRAMGGEVAVVNCDPQALQALLDAAGERVRLENTEGSATSGPLLDAIRAARLRENAAYLALTQEVEHG